MDRKAQGEGCRKGWPEKHGCNQNWIGEALMSFLSRIMVLKSKRISRQAATTARSDRRVPAFQGTVKKKSNRHEAASPS